MEFTTGEDTHEILAYEIQEGDTFYIKPETLINNLYLLDPPFYITGAEILDTKRAWWQFWKPRKVIGYRVLYTKRVVWP